MSSPLGTGSLTRRAHGASPVYYPAPESARKQGQTAAQATHGKVNWPERPGLLPSTYPFNALCSKTLSRGLVWFGFEWNDKEFINYIICLELLLISLVKAVKCVVSFYLHLRTAWLLAPSSGAGENMKSRLWLEQALLVLPCGSQWPVSSPEESGDREELLRAAGCGPGSFLPESFRCNRIRVGKRIWKMMSAR